MKRFNGFKGRHGFSGDPTLSPTERMELYCAAHPGSPSAAQRPQLIFRGQLWVALLGPSVQGGIVGIGQTVEAALRAFDAQYLAGLRPPSDGFRRGLYSSKAKTPPRRVSPHLPGAGSFFNTNRDSKEFDQR